MKLLISFVTFGFICLPSISYSAESFCPNGSSPNEKVIWCDSFEDEDLGNQGTIAENYYEFDAHNGDHARTQTESADGNYSLQARWQQGQVNAGHLMRNFGRNPIGTQSNETRDYQEIYWRIYLKYELGFTGLPNKLSRATIFAGSNWSQAMIGHVWVTQSSPNVLSIDPAIGINSNSDLTTTKWNDFDNLKWLGAKPGNTAIEDGRWYCVEARIKLNTPGSQDGVFELWVDDTLQVTSQNINWRNSWTDYGINSIFLSHYWNSGSPKEQSRFIDAFVISEGRIGCISSRDSISPMAPTEIFVN